MWSAVTSDFTADHETPSVEVSRPPSPPSTTIRLPDAATATGNTPWPPWDSQLTPSGEVRISSNPTATNRLPVHTTSTGKWVPATLRGVQLTPSGEVKMEGGPRSVVPIPTATIISALPATPVNVPCRPDLRCVQF